MKPEYLKKMQARAEELLRTEDMEGFGGLCSYLSFHDNNIPRDDMIEQWGAAYCYVSDFVKQWIAPDRGWIDTPCQFTVKRRKVLKELLRHIKKELKNAEAVTEGR